MYGSLSQSVVSSCSLEVQASSFIEATYTGIRAAVFLSRGVSSGRPTPTAQATSIIPHIGRECQARPKISSGAYTRTQQESRK
jgi:hypothetical protein